MNQTYLQHQVLNLSKFEFKDSMDQSLEAMKLIVAYTPFLIIALGVTSNPTTLFFIVTNKPLRKMSSMVILGFISIIDTLSLFTWNINHFYKYHFKINYYYLNIYLCRIMTFIQFFSLQSSGFLLILLTVDRYVAIASTPGSFYAKLPLSTPKSAAIWSFILILIVFLLNSHILILNGYFSTPIYTNNTNIKELNGTLISINEMALAKSNTASNLYNCNKYKTGFNLYPQWDQAHLIVYVFIPALSMPVFNGLLIYKTFHLGKSKGSKNGKKSRKNQQKNRLTISLLAISFAFLISTSPTHLFFSYFSTNLKSDVKGVIGGTLDFLAFLNHSTILFNLLLFNVKFRQIFLFKMRHYLGIRSTKVAQETDVTNKNRSVL